MVLHLCVLLLMAAAAAAAVPEFEAARVLPANQARAEPLIPRRLFSIYGHHLGPEQGCQDPAAQHTELCHTQVLTGGKPASLLYVQERQINFQVPDGIPAEGSTTVVVVHEGQSSRAAMLPVAAVLSVRLESPARVGMPVWLAVSVAEGMLAPRYPFGIWPAYLGCHEVEVRRDGHVLPRIASRETQAVGGIAFSGPPCGSLGLPADNKHTGRLPLHLMYRFDQPGTYEVRYIQRDPFRGAQGTATAWTPIRVLPASPVDRERWLRGLRPLNDVAGLLTDFLPSVLGVADTATLSLMIPYLHHADGLVRRFVMSGLTYWPEAEAAAAVRADVEKQGLSDAAVDFLLRRSPDKEWLVQHAIRSLESDSLVVLAGAVEAVRTGGPVSAAAESAILRAAEHVVRVGDPQTLSYYAAALGTFKDPGASAVLWRFIDRNQVRGQSLIALSWRKDPRDLPRLAHMALEPARGKELDYELSSLPYALRNSYGEAALPYLETMLRRSEFTWVRTQSARELMLAGRPAGFTFVVDAIENKRFYAPELTAWISSQFPTAKAGVLDYVKARAAEERR